MSSSRKSLVHLVVQRYRSARLLLEEEQWVSVPQAADEHPSNSDSNQQRQHCGLLLYVSFAAGADKNSVYSAAESCLNLPVLTTGLWGDGVSEQPSLQEILAHPEQFSETMSASIIIVPQANLISKVKSQGKSIQYHGQIQKTDGEILYDYFCDCIRAAVYELQCGTDCLPAWFVSWKAQRLDIQSSTKSDNQQQPNALDPSLPPEQVFRSDPKYGSFEEGTGMPLTTADGQPLTKSASKKLRKVYDAHDKRHTKWKESNNTDDSCGPNKGVATESEVPSSKPRADNDDVSTIDWDSVLHSPVVAGSFGKRQGLEIKSDMGPFCHVFQV